MLPQICRIGCIHFDKANSADPISTVNAALANAGEDFSDALVVLPEALDLGDKYYCANPPSVFAVDGLKSLSRTFRVAFVAGLKEKARFRKPFNSSFLIDPERVCRLSRKMHGDPNAQWYAPARRGDAKCINYRGLTLASLVCKDAQAFVPAPNSCPLHGRVAKAFKERPPKNSPVLCVPARMTTGTPNLEAAAWPFDINVVIANIKTRSDNGSGIRAANGEWEPCAEGTCLLWLPVAQPQRDG